MATVTDPDDFFPTWHDGIFNKKILIEGDSWVSHPQMHNLARQRRTGVYKCDSAVRSHFVQSTKKLNARRTRTVNNDVLLDVGLDRLILGRRSDKKRTGPLPGQSD